MDRIYIVQQTTIDKNGTIAVQTFYFSTEKQARSNHHYFMSSAMANKNVIHALGTIFDQFGNNVIQPEWYHDEPQTEA